MNRPLTDTILIRVTPEQKAAYQSQGGAAWIWTLIDSLIAMQQKGKK